MTRNTKRKTLRDPVYLVVKRIEGYETGKKENGGNTNE
jgi:hypothetical protein